MNNVDTLCNNLCGITYAHFLRKLLSEFVIGSFDSDAEFSSVGFFCFVLLLFFVVVVFFVLFFFFLGGGGRFDT